MFRMLFDSTKLFLQGRLFRDPWLVMRQWAIGTSVTAGALLLLVACGAPLWLSIAAPSFAGGALAPWLFRNVKFN